MLLHAMRRRRSGSGHGGEVTGGATSNAPAPSADGYGRAQSAGREPGAGRADAAAREPGAEEGAPLRRAGPKPPEPGVLDIFLGERWVLPAILGLALLLRTWNWIAQRTAPSLTELGLDPAYYVEWARRVARGEPGGDRPFFVDPLYAYVLAGLHLVSSSPLVLARALQIGLDVGTVALTASLGTRLLGSRGRGNAAALLAAFCMPLVHATVAIEKTTLSTFLCTLALWSFARPVPARGFPWHALASGAATGLAALTRGNVLALVPLGAWASWAADRASEAQMQRRVDGVGARPRRLALAAAFRWSTMRRAVLFGMGAALVVGVVTARNVVVSGQWVPTTSNFGQNLYIGHQRDNVLGSYHAPTFARPDPAFEESDFASEAERRTGRKPSPVEASWFWAGQALAEIAAAPGDALLRTMRKIWLVFHDFDLPDNDDIDFSAEFSPVLRSPVVWMGQLAPFALLGAIVTWRRRDPALPGGGARLLTLAVVGYAATLVAFFVLGRLRAPLLPALCVLATAGIDWLAARVRAGNRRAWTKGAALVAATFLVVQYEPPLIEKARRGGHAIALHNAGTLLANRGAVDRAVALLERAVEVDPGTVVGSMRLLGDIYLARRDFARAERHMLRVLRYKPDGTLGKQALLRLYERMLGDPRYRDDPDVRRKYDAARASLGLQPSVTAGAGSGTAATSGIDPRAADAHVRAFRQARAEGRWADAIRELQEAVRLGPYEENRRYILGSLMSEHTDPDEMLAYWTAEAERDPKPQTAHYFRALALERKGDLEGALHALRQALAVDPAHEMSQLRWGRVLERQGKREEALEHYLEAARILPDFAEAHEAAAAVLDALGRPGEAAEARARAAAVDRASTRRYVHWARYLLGKGRREAAVTELRRAVAEGAAADEARALLRELGESAETAPASVALRSPAAPPDDAWTRLATDATVRERALAVLRRQPLGTPIWLAVHRADPRSVAFADALGSLAGTAGWQLREVRDVSFRMRPGVYVFSGEDSPPPAAVAIEEALRAAGVQFTAGSGYRAYYEERRRADPAYLGFDLGAASYLVVVGPPP
jgi:tetratricopeptide (TPR) repeat protein